ncbi:nucleoside-diphosphate sugar epimerase/dehydratase [Kangiella sp. TOML190]|uniref:polysaccharide biosynthesis protein n=1 Tax=Kangiella sp. TOML190 TaxID=2931351 RepID=UPI00203E8AF2|nr:nucleoside-diphosphate sugar epimerase/dehydratase [Kangiella sp. TOML190]
MKKNMDNFIRALFSLSRNTKKAIIYHFDLLMLTIAYYSSIALSKNTFVNVFVDVSYLHYFLTVGFTLVILFLLNFYQAVTRFVSLNILLIVFFASIITLFFYYPLGVYLDVPYTQVSSAVIFAIMLSVLLGGSRLVVSSYFQARFNTQKTRVLIYGAGSAGRQLALSLLNGQEYYPVGFVDDDKALANVAIQGINVWPSENLTQAIKELQVEKILLALPSVSRSKRKLIVSKTEKTGLPVQTIPGISDLVSGKMKIDEFQDVDIADLLGRDSVPPVKSLLEKNIKNQSVMVTGAGGSIGSELCRQIILLNPKSLILYELSEYALYAIEKELGEIIKANNLQVKVLPFLGSVVDEKKVSHVIDTFKVDSLYHAAAYKHVPMVEYNISEGIRNNIFGTLTTAQAAINAKVSNFVLISTDKAVRPTNVMGATKRFAELVLQGLSTKNISTRFSMVRFGNVLGSSGSVVPLFKRQIKAGGPVTVTHPDITRFFMTIPEAAQLVLQAGAMSKGGDVFVLDMGEPVKIVELATKLISLMGLTVKDAINPDGDIEISYTGLRPGEKLYEELLIGENVEGSKHPRIMMAKEKYLQWNDMEMLINTLDKAIDSYDHEQLRNILINAPTDFTPSDPISDLLWVNKSKNKASILNFKRQDKR